MSIHISIHGHGRPLVLLHGWGFDSQIWASLISKLKSQYQLYLVDLPGFGDTPCLSLEEFNHRLLNNLPMNFAVAGWSMGGLYATKLALEAPQRITHLVNIASSPRFIRDNDWPGIELQTIESFYELLTEDPHETLRKFMLLQLSGQDSVVDFLPKQMPSVTALRQGLDLLVETDLRQAITHLKLPSLYLFGRLDMIVPSATMRRMQHQFPQFSYSLFDKAAHSLFLSHPDKFIDELEKFLS